MNTFKKIEDGLVLTSNTTLSEVCQHALVTTYSENPMLTILAKLVLDYSSDDIVIYWVDAGNIISNLNTQIGFMPIPHIGAYICNCTFSKSTQFLKNKVKKSYGSGKQIIVIDTGVNMYKNLDNNTISEFTKHNVFTISYLPGIDRIMIPGLCFIEDYHAEMILSQDEILTAISRTTERTLMTTPVKLDKWVPTIDYEKFSSTYAFKLHVGGPICLSGKDNCAVIAGTTGAGVSTTLRFIYSRLMDTYSACDLKILQIMGGGISEPVQLLTDHFIDTTDAFADITQLVKYRTDLYNWAVKWGKIDQLVFPAILISVIGSVKKADEILKLINANSHLNLYLLWTTQEYHSITPERLRSISLRFVLRCPDKFVKLMLPSTPVWPTTHGLCVVYSTNDEVMNHVDIPYISVEEFTEHFKERNLL